MTDTSLTPEQVCDEIIAAFRDVPRPSIYARNGIRKGDYEWGRLEYLRGQSWGEIGSDLKFLVLHSSDDFFWMTPECLYYYLPGYLLGVIRHKRVFVDPIADSLLSILNPGEWDIVWDEFCSHLLRVLTRAQKRAIADWLKLELDHQMSSFPDLSDGAG